MLSKTFTIADLKEFGRIGSLCSSSNQVSRIRGRQEWLKFEKRFSQSELDAMWAEINPPKPAAKKRSEGKA